MPVSKDVAEGIYRTNPAAATAVPLSQQGIKEENTSNYAMAERYSPTEQLYQVRKGAQPDRALSVLLPLLLQQLL